MPPTFLELSPCLAQLATETAAGEENFVFALQKSSSIPPRELATTVAALPVITVPMRRKTQRKMFPASVLNLSMIFPWQMVKMIPNTCGA